MKQRFSAHGFALTPNNLRQVRIPAGATAFSNPAGIAPGSANASAKPRPISCREFPARWKASSFLSACRAWFIAWASSASRGCCAHLPRLRDGGIAHRSPPGRPGWQRPGCDRALPHRLARETTSKSWCARPISPRARACLSKSTTNCASASAKASTAPTGKPFPWWWQDPARSGRHLWPWPSRAPPATRPVAHLGTRGQRLLPGWRDGLFQ